jgi:hypothetical protein
MTMNQTVTPEVLRKLPPDFFDLEQDNLSEASLRFVRVIVSYQAT